MATIATLSVNLLGNVSGLKSALGTAQQDIRATAQSLQSIGSKLTAGVSLPILGVAGAALKGAAEMEQLEVAFTTMLKSGDRAKSLMADLTAFSAQTPFELPEVMTAGKMLLAYGVAAEDVQGTLRQLGDVAAGVGAPIGDIAYLFGTARVSGRLFTADINQFTNRGIPIISALAKTMGVAESSIKKMTEEGKVGFTELQAAMAYLTTNGGQFEGLMAAQSQTISGLFSTLKDNIGITLSVIGRTIVDTFDLRAKLGGAIEVLEMIKNYIIDLAQTNPQLLKMAVVFAAVAAAIGPLIVGLGFVVGAVGNLVPVVSALAGAFAFLVSPLGLVVAGLAALIYFDVGGIQGKLSGLLATLTENFGDKLTDFIYSLRSFKGVMMEVFAGNVYSDSIDSLAENLEHLFGLSREQGAALSTTLTGVATTLVEVQAKVSAGWLTIKDTVTVAVQNFSWADFVESLTWENVVATLADWGTFIAPLAWDGLLTVLDWSAYIGQLAWDNAVVPALDWAAYVTPLAWDAIVTTLSDWGAYISALDWTAIITTVIDWATWIPALSWLTFVTVLEWGAYLVAISWTAFVGVLDWATAVGDGITWADFVAALKWTDYIISVTWNSFVTKLEWLGVIDKMTGWASYIPTLTWSDVVATLSDWGAYLQPIAWDALVTALDWAAYVTPIAWDAVVTTLSDWGAYITSLDWTAIITTAIDWATWVPALTWNTFVAVLEWAVIIGAFAWSTYISKWDWNASVSTLSWESFVTALKDWSVFVVKLASWTAFIGTFAWDSFVSKLDWPSFVPKLSWPSISWPGWKTFIPGFSWPTIPSFPGWDSLIPSWLGGGGGATPPGNNALGTSYWRGGVTWVGETGRELVRLPRGSEVLSTTESARMVGVGGGGPAVVIQQATIRDERDIYDLAYQVDDLRRRQRRW